LTDSTLNLRAEPWSDRSSDPSLRFSSYTNGDPFTPLPRAYPGDPFVIRAINVSGGVDTLHIDGHRVFYENRYLDANGQPEASPQDTIHAGVSERFSLMLVGGAGGPQHRAGDYLYMNGIGRRFRQGAWGLIRVLPGKAADLETLESNPTPPLNGPYQALAVTGGPPLATTNPGNPCPSGAPRHRFAVSASRAPLRRADISGLWMCRKFVKTAQATASTARLGSSIGVLKDSSCVRWQTDLGKSISIAGAQHWERTMPSNTGKGQCRATLGKDNSEQH
jgi:hypothetical protein